jgi:molybdopterin synthase catalytic subunit
MKRQIAITTEPIDEARLAADATLDGAAGAVVRFLGVVRGQEEGRPITALEYEAFEKMADHQFHRLCDQIEQRWPVLSVRLVHRIGMVKPGEPSLWVEVIAPHRAEAFAACQWLIDEMKRVVPIWKKPVR